MTLFFIIKWSQCVLYQNLVRGINIYLPIKIWERNTLNLFIVHVSRCLIWLIDTQWKLSYKHQDWHVVNVIEWCVKKDLRHGILKNKSKMFILCRELICGLLNSLFSIQFYLYTITGDKSALRLLQKPYILQISVIKYITEPNYNQGCIHLLRGSTVFIVTVIFHPNTLIKYPL